MKIFTTVAIVILTITQFFSQQGFGTHVWNVNCYNMTSTGEANATRLTRLQNLSDVAYRGFYTENRVSFETISRWDDGSNPGTANGINGAAYTGSSVNNNDHVIQARRRGFPFGTYTIGTSYDDMVVLRINGVEVWNSGTTLTGTNNAIWTGTLDENSEVEVRLREVGGDSYISLYFNRNAINNGTTTTLTPNTYLCLVDQGLSARPGNLLGEYANDVNGYIALTRAANARLYINGWTFMESNTSEFDYVRIYDGIGTGGTQLAQYLGNQFNARSYTGNFGQNLTVQFRSDGSVVRPGFLLDVTQVGISSFTPADACAGNTITLTGIGFRATRPNGVTINGVNVPYVVNSDNQITITPNTSLNGLIVVDTYYGVAQSSAVVNVRSEASGNPLATQVNSGTCSGVSTLSVNTPRPIAHYPFNGNMNDISGNGLNLSVVSGAPSYLDGGLYLNGGGTMAFQSAATSLLSGATHYTIEFEMNMQLNDFAFGKIFTWAPVGNRSPGIFHLNTGNGLHWRHDSDATPCCGAGGNQGINRAGFNLNQWYKVVGVRKGTQFTLYVDGIQVAQVNDLPVGTRTGNAPFVFGAFGGNNAPQGTIIRDFKIFDHSFDWFTGSCGGAYVSSIPTLEVNPAATTMYFLRAQNSCGTSVCEPIIVSRGPIPAPPITSASNPLFCAPGTTNLTAQGMAPGGQVFQGNGTNAQIQVMQDIPEQNFSIEMWVRTTALNTGIFSVSSGALGAGGHDRHFYLNNGRLHIRVWTGAGWNTNQILNDNQWHHIALTVQNGIGQRVYVDGALIATFPHDRSDFNWQDRFYIGYSNDAGANGHLTGQIDNVRLWNVVRTQAQLIADMHLETPTVNTGLVSHLPLNGNANATTGPNGTATSATWVVPTHYTYTWSGGPSLPTASANEVQTTGSITTAGVHNYIVQAIVGGCSGTNSAAVPVTVDTPTTNPIGIIGSGNYCNGNTVNLSVDGGTLGSNTDWTWYAGSCGSAPIGTGASISVAAGSDTYFVNAPASPGCPATPCVSDVVNTPSINGFLSTDGESATCVVQENGWVEFVNSSSGRLLCSINSFGQDLGSVSATSYVQTAPFQVDACPDPQPQFNTAVLGRRWVITPTTQPTSPVRVRLYFHANEYNALEPVANANPNSSDNTVGFFDLSLSKYHNSVNPSLVNNSPFDNCPSGSTTIHAPQAGNNANALFVGFDANGLYTEYEIPNFSEFWLHGSSIDSPLPVTLTSFNANCEDNGVRVSWSTASELNADYFDVERSRDGVYWETINTQDAAGTTNQAQEYSFMDTFLGGTTVYYRLRQVDNDGKEELYGPVAASCESNSYAMTVFPNPATNSFTVQVYAESTVNDAQLVIYDFTGKAIVQQAIEVNNGVQTYHFNDAGLARGTYIVRIQDNEGKFTPVKLVIQ